MADLNRSVRQLSEKENDQRKINPGAYIFQRPFFKGLIFGGAYNGGAYLRNFAVAWVGPSLFIIIVVIR